MNRQAHIAAIAALLLASACHSEATREKIDAMENGSAPATATPAPTDAPPAVTASAKPFSFQSKDERLDFSFSWPAEAAAIPQLDARLRKEMEQARKEAVETANDDFKSRQADSLGFNQHDFSRELTTVGQSARLLSLFSAVGMFTGGAHPNHGSAALLWDRASAKEIPFASLFSGAIPSSLSASWCAALAKEQATRREGQKLGNDFDLCPKLSDITVAPVDKDGNGTFEGLTLNADPYVAGPYVESDYEIALPWTPALQAALKPEYRASFTAR